MANAGNLASYVDFSNPEAVNWWSNRLENLRTSYGIDSFKFDAGESNWLPSTLLLNDSIPRSMWPAAFTTAYVDTVSKFGRMIEVRVGRRTQTYPIFVRMLDKDSHWGFDNGIKTVIPTLLQMSMVSFGHSLNKFSFSFIQHTIYLYDFQAKYSICPHQQNW